MYSVMPMLHTSHFLKTGAHEFRQSFPTCTLGCSKVC